MSEICLEILQTKLKKKKKRFEMSGQGKEVAQNSC